MKRYKYRINIEFSSYICMFKSASFWSQCLGSEGYQLPTPKKILCSQNSNSELVKKRDYQTCPYLWMVHLVAAYKIWISKKSKKNNLKILLLLKKINKS